jgi:hypothetical protein
MEKARRAGRNESVRETLRRHVRTAAAGAFTEADFWRRLAAEGVLVRHRMSERNAGEITGYSVALVRGPADQLAAARTRDGDPLFFSGGKLAPELSLPQLRLRWVDEAVPIGELKLREADRQVLWRNAIEAVAAAERHVRVQTALGTHNEATDAAAAMMDVLASAANVLERHPLGSLHRALRQYERAARERRGQRVARTPHGERLRLAAVMVAGLGEAGVSEARHAAFLIQSLQRLAVAVHVLRSAQERSREADALAQASAELDAVRAQRPRGRDGCPFPAIQRPHRTRLGGSGR